MVNLTGTMKYDIDHLGDIVAYAISKFTKYNRIEIL